MSLSIREALNEMVIMSAVRVIAGSKGLDQVISWVHISDLVDLHFIINPGKLILTTAFNIPKDSELQKQLMLTLVERKVAGLIIAVAGIENEIPSLLIEEADRQNFPLMTVRWEIPFSNISYDINGRITIEQDRVQVAKQLIIQKEFNQLVINNNGLEILALEASKYIQNGIDIYDSNRKHLVSADCIKSKVLSRPLLFSEEIAFLDKVGAFYFPRNNSTLRFYSKSVSPGLSRDLLISPIFVSNQLTSYLCIIGNNKNIEQNDYVTIESATNSAALIISRDMIVEHSKIRDKKELFESLLTGSFTEKKDDSWNTAAINLGLTNLFQILAIRNVSDQELHPNYLYTFIDQFCHNIGVSGNVIEYGAFVVLVLKNPEHNSAEIAASLIMEEARSRGIQITIGISSRSSDLSTLFLLFNQALHSVQIGLILYDNKPTSWSYDKLGYLIEISEKDKYSKRSLYGSIISSIKEYDKKNNTYYYSTLICLIKNRMNYKKTAQDLFIHRNTLRQRIRKMEETWDFDLSDPLVFSNITFALLAYCLQNGDENGYTREKT